MRYVFLLLWYSWFIFKNMGSTIDEPEGGDTLETQCAAGPGLIICTKKWESNVASFIPGLFGEVMKR